MESRFRVRFWPSRRAKRNSSKDLENHSVPYQIASEGKWKPVFIHQPLGRSVNEKRRSESLALQGVAYQTSRAATPPIIGELPHKGNGPVKLQTSRLLSSGELVTTSGDSDSVLDSIRDGEVFVPGRRDSRSLSHRNSTAGERRPSQGSLTSSPSQRRPPASAPSTWAPFPGSSPLLDIPENSSTHLTTWKGTASEHPQADSFRRPMSHHSNPPFEGLGIHDHAPQGILKNTVSQQPAEAPVEQNPTIRALWKAEHSRLVNIYGQTGVDKSFGEVPWDQKRLSIITDRSEQPAPVALDPLPRPSFENRDSQRKQKRRSRTDGHHDASSDESSHRPLSFMSSAGGYASSYTTRTSIADSDSVNTKDDIRKMVESMRSTYIQALEAREPSLDAIKSMKRKKKRKSTTPAPTPRASSIPTTPETDRAVSAPINGSSPTLRSQRSLRTVSQPIAGIPTLPAIEASPSRAPEPEVGLQRADSATLGALMGESRRSSIRKRASKSHSRQGSLSNPKLRKSSSVSKKPSVAEKENTIESNIEEGDIAILYKDIFHSSDFWQTSPLGSSVSLTPTKQSQPSFLST